MVACVRSHSLVRPLKSWQQLFAGRGRQAVRRQRSSGQLSGRAGAQAQPDLALDDTEWVTLRSGKRVRVDSLGYRPNVAGAHIDDDRHSHRDQ